MRYFEIVSKYKDEDIKLPKRATKYAAGYDFEAAETVVIPSIWKTIGHNLAAYLSSGLEKIKPVKPTLIPTGVKVFMQEDEVLNIYNRSGNPFKIGLMLANGVGVIDKDYYDSKAEGHIQFAFWNFFPFSITINKGDRIGQGIFSKFLLTNNDIEGKERKGGFGSSGQ